LSLTVEASNGDQQDNKDAHNSTTEVSSCKIIIQNVSTPW